MFQYYLIILTVETDQAELCSYRFYFSDHHHSENLSENKIGLEYVHISDEEHIKPNFYKIFCIRFCFRDIYRWIWFETKSIRMNGVLFSPEDVTTCIQCILLARKRGKMDSLMLYYILSTSFAALFLILRIRRRRRRRRRRRCWVRPFLRRRDEEVNNTMSALYNELLLVSLSLNL